MDFNDLCGKLVHRLGEPLPGAQAHEPLRAVPTGSLKPVFEHKLPPKPGSVLILLYPEGNSVRIPLTLRSDYLGAHGGQISFPGGKREAGEDDLENALRECEEEIGVNRALPRVLGKLTDFFVIPSNFIVTPVVATLTEKPKFTLQDREVVRILECDLDELIADDAIHQAEILAARQFKMQAPHFLVEGSVVWGATAMMLNELRVIVREIMQSV